MIGGNASAPARAVAFSFGKQGALQWQSGKEYDFSVTERA